MEILKELNSNLEDIPVNTNGILLKNKQYTEHNVQNGAYSIKRIFKGLNYLLSKVKSKYIFTGSSLIKKNNIKLVYLEFKK